MNIALPPSVLRTSPPQGGRVFGASLQVIALTSKYVISMKYRCYKDFYSPPLWGRCHEVTEGGTLQNKEPNYLA